MTNEEKMIRDWVSECEMSCSPLLLDSGVVTCWVESKKIGFTITDSLKHTATDSGNDWAMRNRIPAMTKEVDAMGGRLVHFSDIEIRNKPEIIRSMIRSMLGSTQRLYARQCNVGGVSNKEATLFLNKTHIQGWAPCYLFLGLFHQNEMVCLMGIAKSRFDKNYPWEIVRFSSLPDVTVVGGFSKILKHFRETHIGGIVSYADYSRSNGDVYRKNGFEERGTSKPSYRWINPEGTILYNRHTFMRRNLANVLKEFREEETEAQNAFREGYRRLWDAGQIKFIMEDDRKEIEEGPMMLFE